jgi:O-antigen ligase
MPDISAMMPNWQYHPHNQFLWTWANLGLVGWLMAWSFLVVTVYLAGRTYRRAQWRS